MYVDHLTLADYRSYVSVDVALQAGVTVFVGANGQGKTNLVEAIEYLSTLTSHRVASEIPLVRAGAERAIVRAGVRAGLDDDRRILLEIEINPGRANRAKLNRSPLKRPRELVGMLRTVVFSPEDLSVIKGDPAARRAFLDALVINRWPRMAGVRADYDRVLKQRNALLKSLAGSVGGRGRPDEYAASTLEVWNTQLAEVGAEVLEARLDTVADLMPHAAEAYAGIAPTNNIATAEYRCGVDLTGVTDRPGLRDALLAAMTELRADELRRGVSLVGPHRDDLLLGLGELPGQGVRLARRILVLCPGSATRGVPAVAGGRHRTRSGPRRCVRRVGLHAARATGEGGRRGRTGARHCRRRGGRAGPARRRAVHGRRWTGIGGGCLPVVPTGGGSAE